MPKSPEPSFEVVWEPIPGSSQELAIDTRCHHTLYHGTRGPGKDLEVSTPVLTDSGWKKAGDVLITDKLVALDGTYTEILGIYPKTDRDMCEVLFHDGSIVRADMEHRWLVQNNKTGWKEGWKVRTTAQMLSVKANYSVPYMQGAISGKKWEGSDPYIIGLLLGDGTMGSECVTLYSADDEILNYVKEKEGWKIYKYGDQIGRACCTSRKIGRAKWRSILPKVTAEFKSVPEELLKADPETRLAVLQGLMDSDGTIETCGKMRFVSLSKTLAKNVEYLVWSLGGSATCYKEFRPSLKGGKDWRWRVNLSHNNKFKPFRLTRKLNRICEQKKFLTRGIKSITPVGKGNGVCFSVAHKSHCFICGNWVVTHNTITQLMRFRRRVGLGYGPFWRGVIFDKEYKNFADIIAQSKRFFSKFDDGAKFLASPSDLKWVWPTGEELMFRHAKKLSDYDNFHGHEYPWIGHNELTKHATADLYDKLMSTNRSSFTPERDTPRKPDGTFDTPDGLPLPPIPLEVFSTTNPSGPGHNWVKRRFINCAKNGEVVRIKTKVFDPKKQEDVEVTKTQVAIFGSYRENIYLPAEYIAELDRLTNSDHNLKRAWLFGDWDVTAGGAIDDLWKREVHIVPRFPIPKEWYIDRSMDWGSSHPFSVGWWAEANGEEIILPNGNRFCPAPGSLIQFAEWYGTEEIGTNKGLKMSAHDVAEGIKRREIELMREGWIKSQPWPGPADNQIRDVRESDVDTIEAKMAKVGIRWTESDKSPGSRRNGLQLVRDRLEAALRGEGPGLYFMSHCQASIETLPSLPRDEVKLDDVDTTAEDHVYDCVRYRCLKGSNRAAKQIKVKFAT